MKVLDVFEGIRTVHARRAQLLKVYFLFGRVRDDLKGDAQQDVDKRIYAFLSRLSSRWLACKRTRSVFLKRHAQWLNSNVNFFDELPLRLSAPSNSVGRPKVNFESASIKTRVRRTAELCAKSTTQELVHAAASSLYLDGDRKGAKVIKTIACKDLDKSETNNSATSLSPDEAVHLVVHSDLSKQQYLEMRRVAKDHNFGKLFPSYSTAVQAKIECYPPECSISIAEDCMVVELQALLDHTVSRICKVAESVLRTLTPNQMKTLVLISKWGLDGSGGYTMYKQLSIDLNLNDSHLLVTSVVPLQLYALENGKKIIVWQNPAPSSYRYCRVLNMQFKKQSEQLLKNEVSRVKEEITKLHATSVTVKDFLNFEVKHSMCLTMLDGKVCNALTGTRNSQSCYICNAKPSEMNFLDVILKRPVNGDALFFGLSVLHARIRSFEYLLHVAYRLDIETWQCRNQANKEAKNARKEQIQRDLKTRLGLIVDMPKQGFGSSNDGNTARRFFENASVSAEVTGLNLDLIERFHTILSATATTYTINMEEFSWYTLETAYRCVELYSWYPMPPTVHKLLIHSPAIIRAAPVPIGMLTEDAQEFLHKICKKLRLAHTRKSSRVLCNTDLLHACWVSSDPWVTSLRKLPKRRSGCLSPRTLALLQEPELCAKESPEFEDSEESEDE